MHEEAEATADAAGKFLLLAGAALALFNLVIAFLVISQGSVFLGPLKAGLWGLVVYALAGAVTAVTIGLRHAVGKNPSRFRRPLTVPHPEEQASRSRRRR